MVDSRGKDRPQNRFYNRNRFQQRAHRPQRYQWNQNNTSQRGRQQQQRRKNYWQNRWQNQRRWGRYQNADDEKRVLPPSIKVTSVFQELEVIDFKALDKLSVPEPNAPDILKTCGSLETYNASYDKITTKKERMLQRVPRTFFKVTTADDPVIQDFAQKKKGNVFATDAILSHLMACPRSVFPWDIIVTRKDDQLFFDKRDNSQFDYVTVNETSSEIPEENKDSINSTQSLNSEATFINQNFSQQVLLRGERAKPYKFEEKNPFISEDEAEPVASVAYRYHRWKLSDDIVLVARCEIDGVQREKDGKVSFLTIRALNEFDPKLSGVDWRQKLDTQRAAVLATELKNNSNKLAKFTAQALLAGSDSLKIGYVSRFSPKDNFSHVILGTQSYAPREFANQIKLHPDNMWAIVKALIEVCMKLDNGKYVFVKDPSKSLVRLYKVPEDYDLEAHEDDEEEEEIIEQI